MNKRPFKLVWIEWTDSVGGAGWRDDIKETAELPLIKTIGWLVGEVDQGLTISTTYDPKQKDFCGYISIPKCSIIEWGELDVAW